MGEWAVKFFGLASVSALFVIGCGGGGSSQTSSSLGQASLSIAWPNRDTRLIPMASNSVVVGMYQKGKLVSSQTVPRPTGSHPTSTVTFTDLPYGTIDVVVTAYPNADGTGVAQAVGLGPLEEKVGVTGAVSVSLASTVTKLLITPDPITAGKGLTTNLTASAKDASGNIVLLAVTQGQEPIAWTTADPTIATVAGAGPTAVLTGVGKGSTTVTATFVTDDAGDKVNAQGSVPVTAGTGTVTIE